MTPEDYIPWQVGLPLAAVLWVVVIGMWRGWWGR
jgi:hypothetical protein